MIQAADIMTHSVVTISSSATVADAVNLMKKTGSQVLIVKPRSKNELYSMVTETDIVYKVIAHGYAPKAIHVYEIMTQPCVVISPELGIEYMARLFAQTVKFMKDKGLRALIVKPHNENDPYGIVTVMDIICKLFEYTNEQTPKMS
ncbi:CBS domain-containing protein [Alkalinema pantanalense CENA528]|uniref:CBS domain-containing protein n=1 Tax=Alkalinema pantanalense TaxID=1620705 RepID=UPI003D6F6EC6